MRNFSPATRRRSDIFGGDTGLTYEDLKRRQLYADQMMMSGSRGVAKTPMEGLNRGAQSVMGALLAERLGREEQAGQSRADAAFQRAIGGGYGNFANAGNTGRSYGGVSENHPGAIAADTMQALGKGPTERELLAKTLAAEAGGEGLQGMLAAGAVINNRAKSGGYGGSLRDVIMKPGQFSAWNSVTGYAGGEGGLDMDRIRPTEEAYQAADMLLSGQYEDPTGGATHHYNPAAANPKWGMQAGGDWQRIGNHVFGNADAGRGVQTAQAGGVSPDMLQAISNPYMSDQQRSVLGML